MEEEDYKRRIDLAERDIIRKYKLEGVEEIDSKIVSLYMVVEEVKEDIYSEIEIPVVVPDTMNTQEVLEVFVKILSVLALKEKKEVYRPKNKEEKAYLNGVWGKFGIKVV